MKDPHQADPAEPLRPLCDCAWVDGCAPRFHRWPTARVALLLRAEGDAGYAVGNGLSRQRNLLVLSGRAARWCKRLVVGVPLYAGGGRCAGCCRRGRLSASRPLSHRRRDRMRGARLRSLLMTAAPRSRELASLCIRWRCTGLWLRWQRFRAGGRSQKLSGGHARLGRVTGGRTTSGSLRR